MSADTARLKPVWVLVFVVGVLGLNQALATWWRLSVVPAHKAHQLDAAFLGSDEPVELLVAGDSHARNAVQANHLTDSLNVAVAGETWLKSSFRIPWLLDQQNRPVRRVMLGLDHASFSDWKTEAWQPEAVWGRYVDFWALGLSRNKPFPYAARWLKMHLVPYAGELETLGQKVRGERQFRTGAASFSVPQDRRRSGREAAALHLKDRNPVDPTQVWGFNRLMTDLTQRGIEVILVAYPMSAEYLREVEQLGVTAPWTLPFVTRWLDRPDVTFWEQSRSLTARPDAFYDGDHLNARGGRVFTMVVGKRLDLAPDAARR